MRDIDFFSYCEHHLALMYDMKATVAYIPRGRVIGLSKIARVCDMVGRRLQLQERIGRDIADIIPRSPAAEDIAVRIAGCHSCVTARGIQKPGTTDHHWRTTGADSRQIWHCRPICNGGEQKMNTLVFDQRRCRFDHCPRPGGERSRRGARDRPVRLLRAEARQGDCKPPRPSQQHYGVERCFWIWVIFAVQQLLPAETVHRGDPVESYADQIAETGGSSGLHLCSIPQRSVSVPAASIALSHGCAMIMLRCPRGRCRWSCLSRLFGEFSERYESGHLQGSRPSAYASKPHLSP